MANIYFLFVFSFGVFAYADHLSFSPRQVNDTMGNVHVGELVFKKGNGIFQQKFKFEATFPAEIKEGKVISITFQHAGKDYTRRYQIQTGAKAEEFKAKELNTKGQVMTVKGETFTYKSTNGATTAHLALPKAVAFYNPPFRAITFEMATIASPVAITRKRE